MLHTGKKHLATIASSLLIEHLQNTPNAKTDNPERQGAHEQNLYELTAAHLKPPTVTTGDRSPAAAVMGRRSS